MNRTLSDKIKDWLLPVVLILFILEVLTIPLVFGMTYAGRSESPNHILSYKYGKLTWDSANGVDENGVAKLNLFDSVYENVKSINGDKIIAPGTKGSDIVRLKNSGTTPVEYMAILYRVYADRELPLEVKLEGNDFTEVSQYVLPDGVTDDQIVSAVKGNVKGNEIIDFDISWSWGFGDDFNEDTDIEETLIADNETEESVTVGLYIVVKDEKFNSFDVDEDGFIVPDVPITGDSSYIGIYVALIIISLCILIFLLVEKKKRGNREQI